MVGGLWLEVCCQRCVVGGLWNVECRLWFVECVLWLAVCGHGLLPAVETAPVKVMNSTFAELSRDLYTVHHIL